MVATVTFRVMMTSKPCRVRRVGASEGYFDDLEMRCRTAINRPFGEQWTMFGSYALSTGLDVGRGHAGRRGFGSVSRDLRWPAASQGKIHDSARAGGLVST